MAFLGLELLSEILDFKYVLSSFFFLYRSNGEVVSLRPKSEFEPVAKPKLDSELLPLRPKSVEVDSLVLKSSKESGKKRIKHLSVWIAVFYRVKISFLSDLLKMPQCNYSGSGGKSPFL